MKWKINNIWFYMSAIMAIFIFTRVAYRGFNCYEAWDGMLFTWAFYCTWKLHKIEERLIKNE